MVVGCNQRSYNLARALLGINRMVDISYDIMLVSEEGWPCNIEIRHHPLCDELKDKGGAGCGEKGCCR